MSSWVIQAAAPPATEPTVSVASKKARRPNPIHITPRKLYMAVYADEMGGSSHEFTQHWLSLATENPGLFQAYEMYSKELKVQKLPHIPATQDIQQHIQAILRSPTP
ncbi:hypothetical protein K438DRAFT_1936708 [Mycena galopus ATCC 62051]|nr:hypothetical protein K438DRAFT_1936708 [Mycena galopus ATCC 62051]